MTTKEYTHEIGSKEKLDACITNLIKKGFHTRWNYVKRAYECRRRVRDGETDKIIHIRIEKKHDIWVAFMHLDEVTGDGIIPPHHVLHDFDKTKDWGDKLFSSIGL